MKSCPTCNRTFEDTLTYCVVDGSILSAPFDPEAARRRPTGRDTAPPRTEILPPPPIVADTTGPGPDVNQPDAIPPTVAGPASDPEPPAVAFPIAPEYSPSESAASRPVETIRTPPPKVTIGNLHGGDISAPASYVGALNNSSGGKRAALIALGIAVLVMVVVALWFTLRSRTLTPSGVTAAKQPATRSSDREQLRGASFTESVNGAQIEMISVPGGTFQMGSPVSEVGRDMDEGPQSAVAVANFYISKYEVTQAQYKALMNANPSSFKGEALPVDSVTWEDAEVFCRKLLQITGKGYRLPTEAEWEYASRAGTQSAIAGIIDATTWYSANSGGRTHPVGQKQPNDFGLYDMNGNVWEWCQSKYKPYPYKADDGRENVQDNDIRVMRGGSWEAGLTSCRSAYRRRVIPNVRATIGFRIVLPER